MNKYPFPHGIKNEIGDVVAVAMVPNPFAEAEGMLTTGFVIANSWQGKQLAPSTMTRDQVGVRERDLRRLIGGTTRIPLFQVGKLSLLLEGVVPSWEKGSVVPRLDLSRAHVGTTDEEALDYFKRVGFPA